MYSAEPDWRRSPGESGLGAGRRGSSRRRELRQREQREQKMNSVTAMKGSYDYGLVALSIVLAMFASYAALDLAGRVTATQGRVRAIWLSCGAAAMGLGIWAMHYVGMLAFSLPVPVLYHYPTVIVSLLAAIAASAVALYTVSRVGIGVAQQVTGSLIIGGGIAAMHYIGMAAMRVPAMMEYHWPRVALSVVLAVVISFVALILSFQARDEKGTSWRKAFSALG